MTGLRLGSTMPFKRYGFWLAAVLTMVAASPASALLVQPISIDLSTANTGSSSAITVVNDRNRPNTIEVTINSVTLPESGPPVLTPDTGDNFLVFPPATTIDPGKTQVFRIRWIGDPALAQSKIYMFSVAELPVDQLKTSGVQVLYSIQAVVTVTSPNLKTDTSTVSAARDTETRVDDPGKPDIVTKGVSVTFANAGNAVDYISHYKVTLSIDGKPGWSKIFEGPEVGKNVGLGLVPPAGRRKLFFAVDDVPDTGDIKATIEPISN